MIAAVVFIGVAVAATALVSVATYRMTPLARRRQEQADFRRTLDSDDELERWVRSLRR